MMVGLSLLTSLLLQTPTPEPDIPIWQITQDKVPWVLLLVVALVTFLLGTVMRPLLEDWGSTLARWTKSRGKAGAFRQQYLNSLISQYRHLKTLPVNVLAAHSEYQRAVMELEELYTPLQLDERFEDQERRAAWPERPENRLRSWLQSVRARLRRDSKPTAGDIGLVIQRHPRLVIRGEPGSGKTTLLRFLTLTCARTLRNETRDGDSRSLAKRRLAWRMRRFPILVPLNLLGDVSTWPRECRLVDEIANTLPGELRDQCPKDFFARALARGRCLVMFDGFDELGSRSARGRMARLIDDLANAYPGEGNLFLVSTRIVGYEGQLNDYGFAVRTIQELDQDAVRDLVTRRNRATAISEGLNRSEQEKASLLRQADARAQDLLVKLNRNQRLRALTANPLLLSLVIVVHAVKIELPEQRHILYRDCVEILTERWQLRKKEEAGVNQPAAPDTLTLDQKTILLRAIALTMQQRRQAEGSSAVIARSEVEQLIAARLPDFIAAYLPEALDARAQECRRRAELLLDIIREESGILVERGLDAAGEPVVGFSHLTFQEYLAADAICRQPDELPTLVANVFNPTWREVVLLYVTMQDAGPIVRACLDNGTHLAFTRYLLAGRCLAENKVTVDPQLRREITTVLRTYFSPPAAQDVQAVDELLSRIGGERNFDWLIDGLEGSLSAEEKAALAALGDPVQREQRHAFLQQLLLRVLGQDMDSTTRRTVGCILSGIGDPRDLDEMVLVPEGDFIMGSEELGQEEPSHVVWLPAYYIGKYPITNSQYHAFVKATGHPAPPGWAGEAPDPWLTNHPVAAVSWHDAIAYCVWLSASRGQTYRLPTEAEWEKAARGLDGRSYPWGDEPPTENLCNFAMNVGASTAVGSYPGGASPYGGLDMVGNVWEWCSSLYEPYPYHADDGREDRTADGPRVMRSGGWGNFVGDYVRCDYRLYLHPDIRSDYCGFRVVSPGS